MLWYYVSLAEANDMSDPVNGSDSDGSVCNTPVSDGTVESYENDDRIVLYDPENHRAWMETTQSIQLEEYV